MIPLLVVTALATLGTALLGILGTLALRLCGRRPRWRQSFLVALGLAPVHLFVTAPAALGVGAAHGLVHTRLDERDYAGPQLDEQGGFRAQSRGALLRGSSPFAIALTAADGVRLRAFSVPPAGSASPTAVVILVHGLFRGGLELEPFASDFHELGCHVVMLEMRNHGGSERAPATFGRDERLDVLAAVQWVRGDEVLRTRPLLLFGISLGTAAVVLAAAESDPPPDALVLDSPIDTVIGAAERMLGAGPRGRGGFALPWPFRSLVLTWLQWSTGADLDGERPIDALRRMSPMRAGLVVGGADDHRTPPESTRAMFEALPVAGDSKELWIRMGSGHGDVRRDDPEGYRERLRRLLDRLRGG